MSDDLVTRTTTLPADFGDSLMKGIEETRAGLVTGGNKPFLRLLRTGEYVFGQTNDDVQEGSQWAVNLASLQRGWVCWGDGELLGQVMSSVQVPRPACPPPVNGYPFAEQYGMDLTCISGDDAGMEVVYKNNSYGFKVAFDTLISAIRDRYAVEKVKYWPIITLGVEDYQHKKYGQIFNPILTVVAWADAEGNIEGRKAAPAKVEAAPEAPAPARQRKAPVQPAAEPVQPVSTQQAHVRQRRRPASR